MNQSAVPVFTSVGDSAIVVTSVLTDLEEIAFTNTTSTAINVTVTDGNDVQLANLSSYAIAPNTPYDLQFMTPNRAVSGIKVYANSTGLKFTLHGWRHANFSTTNH